jgi:hypothetical protein
MEEFSPDVLYFLDVMEAASLWYMQAERKKYTLPGPSSENTFVSSFSIPVCLVSCYWPSAAQSFLVPNPAGLMTTFYFLTALGIV